MWDVMSYYAIHSSVLASYATREVINLFFMVWCFLFLWYAMLLLIWQDKIWGQMVMFKYCGFFGQYCLLFLCSLKLEQNNIVRVPSFLGFSFAARMMLELPSVVDTSVFAVDNRPMSKLCKSAFFLHFSLEAGYLFCLLLKTTNVTWNCGHTFLS